MIKKILLFICTLMVTTTCYAYKDTIDGFRGIPWGASLEEVKNSGVFKNEFEEMKSFTPGELICDVKLINPYLCGVRFSENATIGFIDDKFSCIMMYYGENPDPWSSYYQLVNEIANIWGPAYEKKDTVNEKESMWILGNNVLSVTSNEFPYGRQDVLTISEGKYLDERTARSNGF